MTCRILLTLVLTFALLTFATRAFAAPLAANQTVKLPSGKTIKILSISKVEFSKGVMALMLRYETTLSVDERKALSEEVDEFWKIAVKDVERYGYSDAIVSSNETPKGIFLTANRALNFLFEKGADGKWTRLNRADFMAAQ